MQGQDDCGSRAGQYGKYSGTYKIGDLAGHFLNPGLGVLRGGGGSEGPAPRFNPGEVPRAELFDKAGIRTAEHFRIRIAGRTTRLTESEALDAYRTGRLFHDPRSGYFVRYKSTTQVAVVTTKPTGGVAISTLEGPANPNWTPVRWRPGQ